MPKLTVRKSVGGVEIDLSKREHLHFSLTAEGAIPIFSISCTHRTICSETDFSGHPKEKYECEHFVKAKDQDAASDEYGLVASFITATKYTLVVEHHDANHGVIEVLKDLDAEPENPSDNVKQALSVLCSGSLPS